MEGAQHSAWHKGNSTNNGPVLHAPSIKGFNDE